MWHFLLEDMPPPVCDPVDGWSLSSGATAEFHAFVASTYESLLAIGPRGQSSKSSMPHCHACCMSLVGIQPPSRVPAPSENEASSAQSCTAVYTSWDIPVASG